MIINIPGHGKVHIKTVLFDFNGTLAKDGILLDQMLFKLKKLSEKYQVYIITGDTFGSVKDQLKGTDIELLLAATADEKMRQTIRLGADHVLAVGNGNIDYKMFMQAKLSFCVIGDEGASFKAMSHADIILNDIHHVFDMIDQPHKIIASLKE